MHTLALLMIYMYQTKVISEVEFDLKCCGATSKQYLQTI